MPIIQRYLVQEILKSTVATTLILFIILMSNTLGRVLSDISDGDLPIEALLPVMLGQSVDVFNLLLPLGFFLGLIFALGRLYADHELVALQACGFGYRQLYRSMLIVMLPLLLLSIWMSLWLSAEMQQRAIRIVDEKDNVHEFTRLRPGKFNKSSSNLVFFMQSMSEDRTEIRDIIISHRGEDAGLLETAQVGRHRIDQQSGDLFLEVGPGRRYIGSAGEASYRIIDFARHGILLRKKPAIASVLDSDEKSLAQILGSSLHEDRVELSWRVAIPFTLVTLALLAVPLAYIPPRKGRYGKIGWALLIFIVYLNLLGVAKTGLEHSTVPLWLNFWWVHGIFLLLTFVLLRRRTRLSMVAQPKSIST